MNKAIGIIFILVLIATIGVAGYFGIASTKQPEPTVAPQTVSVTTCDIEQTVTAPGNLVNVNIADVKMPATGKLSAVNVRVGILIMLVGVAEFMAGRLMNGKVNPLGLGMPMGGGDVMSISTPRSTERFRSISNAQQQRPASLFRIQELVYLLRIYLFYSNVFIAPEMPQLIRVMAWDLPLLAS